MWIIRIYVFTRLCPLGTLLCRSVTKSSFLFVTYKKTSIGIYWRVLYERFGFRLKRRANTVANQKTRRNIIQVNGRRNTKDDRRMRIPRIGMSWRSFWMGLLVRPLIRLMKRFNGIIYCAYMRSSSILYIMTASA